MNPTIEQMPLPVHEAYNSNLAAFESMNLAGADPFAAYTGQLGILNTAFETASLDNATTQAALSSEGLNTLLGHNTTVTSFAHLGQEAYIRDQQRHLFAEADDDKEDDDSDTDADNQEEKPVGFPKVGANLFRVGATATLFTVLAAARKSPSLFATKA